MKDLVNIESHCLFCERERKEMGPLEGITFYKEGHVYAKKICRRRLAIFEKKPDLQA